MRRQGKGECLLGVNGGRLTVHPVRFVPAADIEAMRLSSNASVSMVHRSISAVTEETVHLFLHQLIVDQLERL
jgi:hypothetical protein